MIALLVALENINQTTMRQVLPAFLVLLVIRVTSNQHLLASPVLWVNIPATKTQRVAKVAVLAKPRPPVHRYNAPIALQVGIKATQLPMRMNVKYAKVVVSTIFCWCLLLFNLCFARMLIQFVSFNYCSITP